MNDLTSLRDKKGLVVGIANHQSIAYGCARACRAAGAELAVTYLNDKAHGHVAPLAQELEAELLLPLDVRDASQAAALFQAIDQRWGKLDFLIHSIAWSPKEDLHGRLVDSSGHGFTKAMDISCHSFIRLARMAEPLMQKAGGGDLVTMSYYGAEKVVENYNLMGPVKAALECSVRYMAAELGPENIRVYAISPGPMETRAAAGIKGFDTLMDSAATRSPLHRLSTTEEVGQLTAFLVSDAATGLSGNVIHVDAGYHVMG